MPKIEKDNIDNIGSIINVLKGNAALAIKIANDQKSLSLIDLKFSRTCVYPYACDCYKCKKDASYKKNVCKSNTSACPCNFIEFLNQLFTTVATIRALEYLQSNGYAKADICLGTTKGRDLTVYDENEQEKAIAEVFAVTDPDSNSKLKDEIQSLAKDKQNGVKRYAFFILAQNNFIQLQDNVESWTAYTPAKNKNANIKYHNNLKIETGKKRAIWTCKCARKNITIVCWSSEGCLQEFML